MKIVCISDTHNRHSDVDVPLGDVLVHAGDYSINGSLFEATAFARWFNHLPHPTKILVPGNHDWFAHDCEKQFRELFNQSVYVLQDSGLNVGGFKFWGSPWQPRFCDWAFNLDRGEALQRKWDLIPDDTQVLITHGPPANTVDRVQSGERVGCANLRATIDAKLPALLMSVSGHIHEDYGVVHEGGVFYVNASSCNLKYQPVNRPIVVELHSAVDAQRATIA